MTHEPGRERHMQRQCERCGVRTSDLLYAKHVDEYWCHRCLDEDATTPYEMGDD